MISSSKIDIKENDILKYDKQLLALLLKDNSSKKNIIWATDNYQHLGVGYEFNSEITVELISGENGSVIRPRVNKTREEQLSRIKGKAEVFTPSWVCNLQSNTVDESWFEAKDVFNTPIEKGWTTIYRPVPFNNGKTWQDYVEDNRLEITCGEAPYLVSRYDTITGEHISVENRIGLLDRKLRIVSENTTTEEDWLEWAKVAVQSTYGFEWQGDNLVLARENILYTYIDFFEAKFSKLPPMENTREIAEIISWNIWQMDGLKGVIPKSCTTIIEESTDLFGEVTITSKQCEGCKTNDFHKHNGVFCRIMDWKVNESLTFVSMLKKGKLW